mgnify:CR=1 FL=1
MNQLPVLQSYARVVATQAALEAYPEIVDIQQVDHLIAGLDRMVKTDLDLFPKWDSAIETAEQYVAKPEVSNLIAAQAERAIKRSVSQNQLPCEPRDQRRKKEHNHG